MEMNKELLAKAKNAKNAEELLSLAKENGMEEFTEENAKAYFEQFHKSGELADEELDNVAGGTCYTEDGRPVVSLGNYCPNSEWWWCKKCDQPAIRRCTCYSIVLMYQCGSCSKCSYEDARWVCNSPYRKKS